VSVGVCFLNIKRDFQQKPMRKKLKLFMTFPLLQTLRMFIQSIYARGAELGVINTDVQFETNNHIHVTYQNHLHLGLKNCQLCHNRSQKGRKEKVQYVKRIFNFEEHSIDTTKSETDTATDTGSETETGSEDPGPSATELPPTTSSSTTIGQ